VHFAHLRSPNPDALSLVLTHGWPGSIVEFTVVSKLLTGFHLILPSIPGFTLSGPVRERGWEFKRVARAWTELMTRLGYERYGVQGGDWGAAISREVGRIDPGRVVGVHLNLIPGGGATAEPTPAELEPLEEAERERTWASWRRQQEFAREQQGYADLQSTRPQTLAYGLTDSPVGQLAWIAEKFAAWTDPATPVDRDVLLTNVMLYWLTRTAGSSGAIYYERAHAPYWGQPPEPSTTPTALLDLAHENFVPLRHKVARTDNVVRWTSHPHGGHFAALEQPEVLAADVRAFFGGLSRHGSW
jgi:pimeloyl-ACP methyl ester carboxylesterase